MTPLDVTSPLSLRLLRRLLLVGALFIVLLAGARAWWEYSVAVSKGDELMADMERTMAAPLSNSLWNFDAEQIALQLEGMRAAPGISYAAVLEHGHVLVERGQRKTVRELTRTTTLSHRQDGRTLPLGELMMQTDLAPLRVQALRAALLSISFSTGMVLLVGFAMFLLTRSMVSRHLADVARHFLSLDTTQPGLRLPRLSLRKKWAGDELDSLCLAVNRMQENLEQTYAKAWLAEHEAKSQARFPEENPYPVLRVTSEGVVSIANPASAGFLEHLGCALGQRLPTFYAELLREAYSTGETLSFEVEYGGRTYAFLARPIVSDGYLNLYGMDVTERKQATEAIRRSLTEKEILLKEIHHRVKNNMQIISSLLFLQTEYVADPADRELFIESQKRIQAMALVHEELYGAADLSSVGMREYVPRLVERVLSSAAIPVRASYDLDETRLPVTRSVPFGLVLNELVMNAVKHAFSTARPDGAAGALTVALRRHGTDSLQLVVEDDGPGLSPDFDFLASPTLGMTLVSSLAQQMAGRIHAENRAEGGARFSLVFPLA
ncbi:MAG: hypothetical protein AUJ49_05085 [Desulfovibrionaceae bacterium CG1_02_65_16]|nr:MAG: hypothetical protein AUJ49_05085 [Desulfovibrionaceae bacterium CG1_02_65_16]